MPRFFFDTDDGEHVTRDKDGITLSCAERARTEAMMLLRDLIYGVPATGKTILGCVVRGEDGLPVHRVMMTVEGEVALSAEPQKVS